ncbi:MAG: hypothetical protein GY777_24370 [Candidatus Brocadiaceae bacterium]|nr:hypothetical protein [Candidatus Brocadiaceae bacterium]
MNIYNAKLREYRRLKKISSRANPLPDLMEKGYVVELPFGYGKKVDYEKASMHL